MIQIVEKIFVKNADVDAADWCQLPIVPATATIETQVSKDDAGWLSTRELKAILMPTHPFLFRNHIVRVAFDDGETLTIGSKDIPVHISVRHTNAIEISFEYKSRGNI